MAPMVSQNMTSISILTMVLGRPMAITGIEMKMEILFAAQESNFHLGHEAGEEESNDEL